MSLLERKYKQKLCVRCNEKYLAGSWNSKYCPTCRDEVEEEKSRK